MQTEKLKKAKKPYAIKQDSIKRVCNALVEISYFNEQETVESKWLRAICNENKVPMLFNAMLTLGYLKKIKHSVYQVMYSREIVNEKLGIKMYKQYNKIKKSVANIYNSKKAIEQPLPTSQVIEQEVEQPKQVEPILFQYALIREEDILNAIRFKSLESLMQCPPNENGKYVVVALGQKLEIKTETQVILG